MVLRLEAALAEQDETLQALELGQRVQSLLTHMPDEETRFPESEECSDLRAELLWLKKQTGEVLQEITNMKLDIRRKDATILELGRQAGALKSANAWRSVRRASIVDGEASRSKSKCFKDAPRTQPGQPLRNGGLPIQCNVSQRSAPKLRSTRSGTSMLSSRRAPPVLRTHATLLRTRAASVDTCTAFYDGKGSPGRAATRPEPEQREEASAKPDRPAARVCIQRIGGSRLLRPLRPIRLSANEAGGRTLPTPSRNVWLRRAGSGDVDAASKEVAGMEPMAPGPPCQRLMGNHQMLRPHLEEPEGTSSSSCSEEDSEAEEMCCDRPWCVPARPQHEYLLKLDLTLVSQHMANSSFTEGVEASAAVPQTPRGRPPVAWWHSSEVTAPASARGHAPFTEAFGGSRRREPRSLYVLELVTPRTAVSFQPNSEDAEVHSPLLLLRPPCEDTPNGGGGRPSPGNISTSSDEDDIRTRLNKDIAKRAASVDIQCQDKDEAPCQPDEAALAHVLTTQVPTPARALKSTSGDPSSPAAKPVEA
ncbi:SNW1 [Symbiodinium natans]|uniref:SNW1 protein n=1 Tax=Symbiodinium natans TaxID=878477 RepID=A0A812S1P9_9DINO|nr:SNW1 [Symbiodinium natans]